MGARKDQNVWWRNKDGTIKSDRELRAVITRHNGYDSTDFYHGTGNYSHVGGAIRLGSAAEFDAIKGTAYVQSFDTDVDGASDASADVASDATVVLEALRRYDAADRRRKLTATAEAVKLAKLDVNTGKVCMTDLAKILGVSRPSAIGRFQTLLEVASSVEFWALMVECRADGRVTMDVTTPVTLTLVTMDDDVTMDDVTMDGIDAGWLPLDDAAFAGLDARHADMMRRMLMSNEQENGRKSTAEDIKNARKYFAD
jgi:hypothetical protein